MLQYTYPMRTTRITQFVHISVLLLFLAISVWGIHIGMHTDMANHMPGCTFMSGGDVFCQMNITEHIAKWQRLFIALLPFSIVLLLLVVASRFFFNFYKRVLYNPHIYIPIRSSPEKNPNVKLQQYLLLAFQDGILQPRIYA